AMGTLAFERVAIATGRVNTTKAVDDLVVEIRLMTDDAGHPLSTDPHVRQKVADLWARALVHYTISQRVIPGAAAGEPPGPVTTADELRARSVADIGAFWDTVVHDLGIEFRTPYSQVVDLTRGIEYPEWFVGGTINIVDAALSRWKASTPEATAVVHEAENG